MGLFSKSNSDSSDAAVPPKTGKAVKGSGKGGASADVDIVREARTSARRRLIGAALLLGIGIIGFPLLFETQPRPIPVDIQIDIPSKDGAAPLAAPASRVAGLQGAPQEARASESNSASGVVQREVVEAALPPLRSAPVEEPDESGLATAGKPVERKPAVVKPVDKPAARPTEKPAERVAEKQPEKTADKPAEKLAEKSAEKPAEKPPAAASDDGRYVVQIGAFAEANGAREARMKVERMGMKTYTQVIESATGRRIRVRVGPYTTKTEAEKAASKIKSGGLQAAILLL